MRQRAPLLPCFRDCLPTSACHCMCDFFFPFLFFFSLPPRLPFFIGVSLRMCVCERERERERERFHVRSVLQIHCLPLFFFFSFLSRIMMLPIRSSARPPFASSLELACSLFFAGALSLLCCSGTGARCAGAGKRLVWQIFSKVLYIGSFTY